MKWFKRITFGLLFGVFIIALFGWIYVETQTYDAVYDDVDFLASSNVIANLRVFEHTEATANIIIYPGGLVQRDGYAYLAYLLSLEGFNVYLVGMPLNLAILGTNFAKTIIEQSESTLPWYIGGHSLGGASASIFVNHNKELVEGIFFLGAYPAGSSDLSMLDLNVLSITASNDLLLNQDNFEDTKKLLPDHTVYQEIIGGNHAYFGFYGEQKGDGTATITRELQHTQTVLMIKDWITS
jgi:hypothetical protein